MSARTPLPVRFETMENRVLLSALNPSELQALGNRVFFIASDGVHGRELWVSDGTASGTRMVRDIRPGSGDGGIGDLTVFGNRLAFRANDGSNGTELWVSDGTAAGTFMLADTWNGSQSGFPAALEAIGNTLYFSTRTNQHGRELWKSDGTTAGTVLVKDIYTGNIGSSPFGFTAVNGTVFFNAECTTTVGQTTTYYGEELWKTDGTAAGTVMVKDIRPGYDHSYPSELINLNGTLLFTAHTTEFGEEVWRSDGTDAGTVLVTDINPGFYTSHPEGLRTHGGLLYFNAIDGEFEHHMYRTDGTAAGTQVVPPAQFAPGFAGFLPANFIDVGGTIHFSALGQAGGVELWRTNHTPAGTQFLHQIVSPEVFNTNPYIQPTRGRAGSQMFFTAFDPATVGLEPYVVTGNTTMLLRDIFPGSAFEPSPQNFTDVNGRLFFTANDGVHGTELWISDGTPAGTRRVMDPALPPRNPRFAVPPSHGTSVTDGVSFGEQRIADFLSDDDQQVLTE